MSEPHPIRTGIVELRMTCGELVYTQQIPGHLVYGGDTATAEDAKVYKELVAQFAEVCKGMIGAQKAKAQ